MSLKGVHILFIVLSIVLAVMMSVWALRMYSSPLLPPTPFQPLIS